MNPAYQRAHFMLSAHRPDQAPPDGGREVAFAGRSNAGKSSALNALTTQNRLARTSKQPGRTQQLNFFALDEQRRLVDLPGYGYAKVPLEVKRHWHKAIEGYFARRQSLTGLVVIMDVRHPLTEFDRQMIAWCVHRQLPARLVLTKADKLKRGPAQATLLQVRRETEALGPITAQLFSATKRSGIEELQAWLDGRLGFAAGAAEEKESPG